MKKVILICLSIFVSISSFAQNKQELNKNVEVVKKYSPKVGSAVKYDIIPESVTKLVFQSPVFDYSIAYRPEPYSQKISALESFDIAAISGGYDNGYAEVGLGYPLKSKASIYYTTKPKDKWFVGGGLTHDGFWGKLKNDENDRVDAFDTQNSVFGLVNYKTSNFKIDAQLQYDYDSYDKYGVYFPVDKPLDYPLLTNSFNKINYSVSAGTLFSPSSKWNLRGYSYGTYIADNNKFTESDINIGMDASLGFINNTHRLMLSTEYSFYSANRVNQPSFGDSDPYPYSGILDVSPSYRRTGKHSLLEVELGLVTLFNKNTFGYSSSADFKFLPSLRYELRTKRFKLFTGVQSEYNDNTYASLIDQNPYMVSGTTYGVSNSLKGYLGLGGTVSTWFNWQVESGYEKLNNEILFVNFSYDLPNISNTVVDEGFTPASASGSYFYVETFLSVEMIDKIRASVNYRYESAIIFGRAQHNLDVGVRYRFHPKWTATLNGELLSSRSFLESHVSIPPSGIVDNALFINNIPTTLDLGVGVEYEFSKLFTFTADISNILNEKLYQFNHYSGVGINAMLGVNISF